MAPTNWDHDAHLALLQAVIARAPPTQAEWDQILEDVGKKGYVYTSGAAMQHLQKLRRKEGTTATANGGNDDAGQKKTPNKKPGPKATANSNKRGPKRKSTADATKAEDDDDLDMNGSSPTKKVKTENNNTTNALEDEDEDNLPPIC